MTTLKIQRGNEITDIPLYCSAEPSGEAVYLVKTYRDGRRLAFDKGYSLIGDVQATEGEWEAALVYVIESWPGYEGGEDHAPGDAVWFDLSSEHRERYRRHEIEKRPWD
jgi:hypothetical protein